LKDAQPKSLELISSGSPPIPLPGDANARIPFVRDERSVSVSIRGGGSVRGAIRRLRSDREEKPSFDDTVRRERSVSSVERRTLYFQEDVESLLNTMMLLCALFISFSVSLTFGTLNHDDWVDADFRALESQIRSGRQIANSNGDIIRMGLGSIPSYSFIILGSFSNQALLVSLGIYGGLYVSLCIQGCRDDQHRFQEWSSTFWRLGLVASVSFVVGLASFILAAAVSVSATYPKYNQGLHGLWVNGTIHEDCRGETCLHTLTANVTSAIGSVIALIATILPAVMTKVSDRDNTPRLRRTLDYPTLARMEPNLHEVHSGKMSRAYLDEDQFGQLDPADLVSIGIPLGHSVRIISAYRWRG
jgi:hypothetical protein